MIKHVISAAMSATALAGAASAQTTQRDLEVIGRAMSFVQGEDSPSRVMAIAHAGDAAAEAEAVAGLLGGGLSTGRVTITGRIVDAGDAGGFDGADVVLLLGSAAEDAAVGSTASSGGRLTVSTHMGCVSSGVCVMGVQSDPAVRIVVNRGAASSAGVSFDAAFAMMIEEI